MPAPASLLKGFARAIAVAKPDPTKRIAISDPDTRGLYVRITPKGAKTYTIVAMSPAGKQVWAAIGSVDEMSLDDARERAREGVKRIKAGEEPFPDVAPKAPPRTFASVRDDFLKRHVRREGQDAAPLRSAGEIHRIFYGPAHARWILGGCKGDAPKVASDYIPKAWDARAFADIRRIDITELLDAVQDKSGSRQADAVLAQLSSMFNWYASRADDYVSPIVRGMKRTKAKERARKRILTDDEIRTVWTGATGTFGALVKVALLTGQRREKLAGMRWDDIADGVWTIRTEAREKGNAERLKLSALALDVMHGLPRMESNPHVFAGRGAKAIAGFSKSKIELDKRAPVAPWVLHDLRRTARSLMARARVDREIAERVLGHAITGVEGVYDRYDYFDEKADALAKLAGLVALVLNPASNVVEIGKAVA